MSSRDGKLLSFFLLLICCSGCAGPAKPAPILATVSSARLEWKGRMPVIHLSGSPYDMGYQHGSLLRREVRASVANLLPGLGRWMAGRKLDKAWKKTKPSIPERYLEEMEGLADGAEVPLKLLERVHALPDLISASSDPKRYAAVFVYHPKGKRAFVSAGWLGFIGVVSGVNEKGIAVEGPAPFLQRRVLEEATDLKEATDLVNSAAVHPLTEPWKGLDLKKLFRQ